MVYAGNRIEVVELTPGLHTLTNGDLDDPNDERHQFLRRMLTLHTLDSAVTFLAVASRPSSRKPNAEGRRGVVLTGGEYRTVSSTLLALSRKIQHSTYQYSPGPPSETPYDDLSALLRQVLSAGRARKAAPGNGQPPPHAKSKVKSKAPVRSRRIVGLAIDGANRASHHQRLENCVPRRRREARTSSALSSARRASAGPNRADALHLRAELLHGAGQAELDGVGLPGDAPALDADNHVDLLALAGLHQRGQHGIALLDVVKELLQRAVIDGDLALAGPDPHAGDRGLAPACAQDVAAGGLCLVAAAMNVLLAIRIANRPIRLPLIPNLTSTSIPNVPTF